MHLESDPSAVRSTKSSFEAFEDICFGGAGLLVLDDLLALMDALFALEAKILLGETGLLVLGTHGGCSKTRIITLQRVV